MAWRRRLSDGQFHLGLAAWAFAGWRGRYFPAQGSTLASYAQVFDCVEGNTTFYSLPSAALVARWRGELEQRGENRPFHFCFKLPRDITHRRMLPDEDFINEFFGRIAPLRKWFGPFMVQLPRSVGPGDIARIESLLSCLPKEFDYVVEARHPLLFSAPEAWLQMLARRNCARVILDSRPIYDGAPAHPDIDAAENVKPSLPLLLQAPDKFVLVRLICHPLAAHNRPFLEEWSLRLTKWLASGTDCFLMVHCPNDLYSPPLARQFNALMVAQRGVPALPPWPVPQLSLDW